MTTQHEPITFTIAIPNGSEFNAGWVAYVLGMDRDEQRGGVFCDGWDMAQETRSLDHVRYVFHAQRTLESPQYEVTAR